MNHLVYNLYLLTARQELVTFLAILASYQLAIIRAIAAVLKRFTNVLEGNEETQILILFHGLIPPFHTQCITNPVRSQVKYIERENGRPFFLREYLT